MTSASNFLKLSINISFPRKSVVWELGQRQIDCHKLSKHLDTSSNIPIINYFYKQQQQNVTLLKAFIHSKPISYQSLCRTAVWKERNNNRNMKNESIIFLLQFKMHSNEIKIKMWKCPVITAITRKKIFESTLRELIFFLNYTTELKIKSHRSLLYMIPMS